jgi:hypothetical protein
MNEWTFMEFVSFLFYILCFTLMMRHIHIPSVLCIYFLDHTCDQCLIQLVYFSLRCLCSTPSASARDWNPNQTSVPSGFLGPSLCYALKHIWKVCGTKESLFFRIFWAEMHQTNTHLPWCYSRFHINTIYTALLNKQSICRVLAYKQVD